jgi:hypothetical protein
MNIKSFLLCGFLLLAAALTPSSANAQGMRPATKLAVGEIARFTLASNETRDFAIQLGTGNYYVAWDLKRVDDRSSNIIAKVNLLKSNGVAITDRILSTNELGVTARTGTAFKQAKPVAARLRVVNDTEPLEVLLRVVPAAKMAFVPFPFGDSELKPLGIGANEGKGGTLQPYKWAYHSATMPAGAYDVSLYLKRVDGRSSNIMGRLQRLDSNGFIVPDGRLNMNENGTEARKDMRIVLKKPGKVLFHVTNEDAPLEYTIGIDKATD